VQKKLVKPLSSKAGNRVEIVVDGVGRIREAMVEIVVDGRMVLCRISALMGEGAD
jgi:hypothetical protein